MMLTEGTRRFDLYDFFTILIPGAAFTLGLLPFLPEDAQIFTTGFLGILLVAGFIFGRGIQATAYVLERRFGTSHRDKFKNELLSPDYVEERVVDQFYNHCRSTFDRRDLPNREDLGAEEDKEAIRSLYGLVRSYIHMDARGRSRTFQAVLDFFRSAWVGSFYLAVLYMLYAFATAAGLLTEDIVGYTSYIGSLSLHPVIIFFTAAGVFGAGYASFEYVRSDYRAYFVQYLMTDFIILRKNAKSGEQTSDSQNDAQSGNSGASETKTPTAAITEIETETE